jgi:ABC-type sugar transport system ATPase subunit
MSDRKGRPDDNSSAITLPPAASGAVLSVRGLTKRFGAIAAVKEVSLDLHRGEIRALCGENGAGKSTLIKMLTGVYQPDSGTISLDGQPCAMDSPLQAQRLGIAVVAQELSLCPDLSVLDNIWLGSMDVPFLHRRAELRRRAQEALLLLGAEHIGIDTLVSTLTMGERQMVEIARMLTRNAGILLLDEPTATLSDSEIEKIFAALKALKREGHSVIYISHRLAEIFRICDSVTVLRNGELVATCKVVDIDRKALIEMMLGRAFDDMYPEHFHVEGESILEINDLAIPAVVNKFSLNVLKGDIVFIAGQVGSGAEGVIRAIAGLVYDASGSLRMNKELLRFGSPQVSIGHEVMFVSGERAEEGIFRARSVLENLVATRLAAHSRFGFINPRALDAEAVEFAGRVGVDPQRLHSRADELSGGNQQKLAIGRCLGRTKPGVIVMIEPTRGIDVGARAEIYQLMRDFCAQGYGLLVASTDLEEVIGVADVIVTMYRSRQVGCYRGKEITMQRIVADITHPVA